MIYFILLPLFFIIMLLYLRIADRYNIIDHPNKRSSHTQVTIRGGGIIFPFAAVTAFILHSSYWLPILGIIIIAIISYLDDLHSLSGKLRIIIHLIAVTFLFIYLHLFSTLPLYGCMLLYILMIGIINAYNFMDGINGITGTYSLVVLGGLQYINLEQIHFVNADIIWLPMLACLVFLFFNFRKKAKCFAGDVGSITIAFWIIMLLFDLVFTSNNWTYMLFLTVYGVDAVLTIIHRFWLREKIFEAHRLHFYQLLANEQKLPHLLVSAIYALIQLIIIVWIINTIQKPFWFNFMVICIPLTVVYIFFKSRMMKDKNRNKQVFT